MPPLPTVVPPKAFVDEIRTTKDARATEAIFAPTSGETTATSRATPVAAVALPTPVQQIVSQLQAAILPISPGVTEVQLNPEELGRIRLVISGSEQALTLSVQADRPETADLMRRHIDGLAEQFRAMGFQDLSFQFQGQGHAGQADDSPDGAGADTTTTTEPDPDTTAALPLAVSGLDLRL